MKGIPLLWLGAFLLGGCNNGLGAPCGRHSECSSGYCSPDFTCDIALDASVVDGSAPDVTDIPSGPDGGDIFEDEPDAAVDATPGAQDAVIDAG